jgi:hypothetical protein
LKTQKTGGHWWQLGSRRVMMLTLTALMLLGCTTGVMQIASTKTANAWEYSGYRNMSWGSALGYAVWDEDYGTGHNDYFYASVTPASLLTGKCLITAFDWYRYTVVGSNHYDARIARSCKSNTFHETYGFFESAGASLLGMQKLGQCAGTEYAETGGNCVTQPDSDFPVSDVSLDTACSAQWTRGVNNGTAFYNGGDPTSCTY